MNELAFGLWLIHSRYSLAGVNKIIDTILFEIKNKK